MNFKKTVATICAASTVTFMTPLQQAIADTLRQGETQNQRPNFVNIVIDDMGFSDLGAFGGEIETPNLDKLAQQGTILNNFYASPTSTPSRGMLFTGKDMHQVGTGNLVGWANTRPPQKGLPGYLGDLSADALPFPELLQQNGYHTMMVGKWDLGSEAGLYAHDRGFKQSLVLLPGGAVHYITNKDGELIRARPRGAYQTLARTSLYNENGKEFSAFPKKAYAAEFYTDTAIKMLDNWKNTPSSNQQPFYLNVSHIAPHSPFQAPAEIIAKYQPLYEKGWDVIRQERFDRLKELGFVLPDAPLPPQPKGSVYRIWTDLSEDQKKIEAKRMAIYAAMIHVMDQQVGRLIDHLKAIGEYDNTVFLVLSDNGGAFLPTSGAPATGRYRNQVFTGDCSKNGDLSTIPTNFDENCRQAYENMGSGTSFINPVHEWGTVANMPFKRYKGDTFEGGIHTAAFVYYPKSPNTLEGVIKTDECLRSIMDIAPTILEMANIEYPDSYKDKHNKPMQGVSMTDLFSTSPKSCDKERWLAWEQDSVKGVRKGDWKLSQKWWETQSRWDPNWYLYNLADDPFEQNDLSEQRSDKLEEMKHLYHLYMKENGVVKVGSKILPELYRSKDKLGEQTLIMGGISIDYNNFQTQTKVHPNDHVEINGVIRPAIQHIGKPGKVALLIVPFENQYNSSSYKVDYYILTPEGSLKLWKSEADLGSELPPHYKAYAELPDWIEITEEDVKEVEADSPFVQGHSYDVMFGYWLDEEGKMIYNSTPVQLTWEGNQPQQQQPNHAHRDKVD